MGKMYKILLQNVDGQNVRRIFEKAFIDISSKFDQRLTNAASTSGEGATTSTDILVSVPNPPYNDLPGQSLGDRLLMDIAYVNESLSKLNGIAVPLQQLVLGLAAHLQTRLPPDDGTRSVHSAVLAVLMRTGKLPRST